MSVTIKSAAKLSCILPVALREPGLDEKRWRHSPDEGARTRLRLMLLSFTRMFRQDDLDRFVVVCPESEVDDIYTLLQSITNDARYEVIAESVFCSEIELFKDKKTGAVHGWYAQQLIKLAAAQHFESEFYITFDSDIICTKPSSYTDIIHDGRALLNIETPADYARVYDDNAATKAAKNRDRRFKACRKFLGQSRPAEYAKRYYGETPVVMHTASVRALCDHITYVTSMPWQAALANELQWTEYCLYFQFLEIQGCIDQIYVESDCNAVLDWEGSIWHVSDRYRMPRDYTIWPWPDSTSNRGFFAAVQSRLDPDAWLPESTPTREVFYEAVERRLFAESSD